MINKLLSVINPLIATVPLAGGIATAISEYQANIKHKKLEDFVTKFILKLNSEQENIKKKQEKMAEALECVAHFVERDPLQKSNIYANCLIQYCTTDQDIETMINIVQLIENLLPEDIKVLSKLSNNGIGDRIDDALSINKNTNPITISKYNFSVKKLEARGLIVQTQEDNSINPTFREAHTNETYPYSFFIQYYQPLHVGQELLKIWKINKNT